MAPEMDEITRMPYLDWSDQSLTASVCAILSDHHIPADLTMSKRPGTSYRIKIHFAVFKHLYLLFSFMKLVETL